MVKNEFCRKIPLQLKNLRLHSLMTKAKEQAITFVSSARKYGWNVERASGNIVTITKRFTPGNMEELTDCDMEYFSILCDAPLKGGSVWGTDCGGIGAMAALRDGNFRMNKSGSGKRFLAEVEKLLK